MNNEKCFYCKKNIKEGEEPVYSNEPAEVDLYFGTKKRSRAFSPFHADCLKDYRKS